MMLVVKMLVVLLMLFHLSRLVPTAESSLLPTCSTKKIITRVKNNYVRLSRFFKLLAAIKIGDFTEQLRQWISKE